MVNYLNKNLIILYILELLLFSIILVVLVILFKATKNYIIPRTKEVYFFNLDNNILKKLYYIYNGY